MRHPCTLLGAIIVLYIVIPHTTTAEMQQLQSSNNYYMQDSVNLLTVGNQSVLSQYAPYEYWDVTVDGGALLRYLRSHGMDVPNETVFHSLLKYGNTSTTAYLTVYAVLSQSHDPNPQK
jgi:hypothetical protein